MAEAYLKYLVHQGRPGNRREELTIVRAIRRSRRSTKTLREGRTVHDRRGVRRLGQGAEGALRRRRRLRPDLQELIVTGRRAHRERSDRDDAASCRASVSRLGLTPDLAVADRSDPARRPVSEDRSNSVFDQFLDIVTSRRTLHALKLSFGLSFCAALVNLVFGTIIVWALVRYRFPGRRLFDAIVDIPFALPTAVAGIALTTLFARERLARRAAGRTRHQGRVHAARHFRRAGLHRIPVRGAHRAAGAGRSRCRDRGSRGLARRQPLADRVAGSSCRA